MTTGPYSQGLACGRARDRPSISHRYAQCHSSVGTAETRQPRYEEYDIKHVIQHHNTLKQRQKTSPDKLAGIPVAFETPQPQPSRAAKAPPLRLRRDRTRQPSRARWFLRSPTLHQHRLTPRLLSRNGPPAPRRIPTQPYHQRERSVIDEAGETNPTC